MCDTSENNKNNYLSVKESCGCSVPIASFVLHIISYLYLIQIFKYFNVIRQF